MLRPYGCCTSKDVICSTAFGQQLNMLSSRSSDLVDDVKGMFAAVQSRMYAILPYWKIPGLGPLVDDGDKIRRSMDKRCMQAMENAKSGKSIAEKLRAMADDKFTTRELLDNFAALFAAGTDTTSLALSWVFYHLSCDQQLQEAVAQEVRKLPDGELGLEQLNSLRMVRAVWLETLRFTGPAEILGLETTQELVLAGRKLPPGTQFITSFGRILRSDPQLKRLVGNDLDVYRPSRWLGPEGIVSAQPFDTLAFGYGPRICLGMRLAEYEGLLTIAKVIQKFVLLKWEKPTPEAVTSFVSNEPVEPISIRVQPRTW